MEDGSVLAQVPVTDAERKAHGEPPLRQVAAVAASTWSEYQRSGRAALSQAGGLNTVLVTTKVRGSAAR